MSTPDTCPDCPKTKQQHVRCLLHMIPKQLFCPPNLLFRDHICDNHVAVFLHVRRCLFIIRRKPWTANSCRDHPRSGQKYSISRGLFEIFEARSRVACLARLHCHLCCLRRLAALPAAEFWVSMCVHPFVVMALTSDARKRCKT